MLVGAISSVSSIVQHAQASETSSLIPSILDLRTIGQLVDTAPSNASANANDSADGNRATHLRSPFEGLVATMVRCLECGYVSAVRHHLSSVLTLSLPHPTTVSLRMYGGAPLQQCLAEHFGSERLDDYICRRCAVTNTLALIETQVEVEHRAGRNGRSSPELAELCQARDQLRHALATNSIETVTDSESKLIAPPPNRRRCVRQTALARPPAVLALHLSRSLIVPSGHVVKNTSPVVFPAVLDIQRYTTTEYLESSSLDREVNPSGGQYKLSAVIVHAGTHGSGHFVAYRRLSDG
ncbi:cysteine proteinase, partial [Ramicandelaber brevisporus]